VPRRGDADQLAAAADEVEAGRGPVAVSRPGHKLVVLVSAEEWQRLEELTSAEATAWWRRDAAERARSAEEPREGEEGPGWMRPGSGVASVTSGCSSAASRQPPYLVRTGHECGDVPLVPDTIVNQVFSAGLNRSHVA
jgi:PHD/YefM family antitoxin component YafN of YafNO toxin-antitoxin module